MKLVIITDIDITGDGEGGLPIVKGRVVYESPALIILDVIANSTHYPNSDVISGRQRFNKEFFDVVILKEQPVN